MADIIHCHISPYPPYGRWRMYEISVLALTYAGRTSEQEDGPAGLTLEGPSALGLAMHVDLLEVPKQLKGLDRCTRRVEFPE